MIDYEKAVAILSEVAGSSMLGSERVDLASAVGRIACERVTSGENVPPFDNSAMDGFAVRADEVRGANPLAPIQLAVLATVAAGDAPAETWSARDRVAVEIMTGAPMPRAGGFDAVVRVEDTQRTPEGDVLVTRPVERRENVRDAGTDIACGQALLAGGERIQPEHVMALASVGCAQVLVRRRPLAVVLSTGKELVAPTVARLKPGEIRNSTSHYLAAALASMGAEVRNLGIVGDEPARFRELVEAACAGGADLMISTGAVSMGRYDFVKETLIAMGAEILFHKVAIRPGKPLLFAKLPSGALFFGVPGNPVSTAVASRFFIDPAIRALCGVPPEGAVLARLSREVPKPQGLRCFYKARVIADEGALRVEALNRQASYQVASMLESNAWVEFSEGGAGAPADSLVRVRSLRNSWEGVSVAT